MVVEDSMIMIDFSTATTHNLSCQPANHSITDTLPEIIHAVDELSVRDHPQRDTAEHRHSLNK